MQNNILHHSIDDFDVYFKLKLKNNKIFISILRRLIQFYKKLLTNYQTILLFYAISFI